MTVYVVTTNYFEGTNHFGVYSSLLNAQVAIHRFIQETDDILHYVDNHDYSYVIIDRNGEDYWIEIETDTIDTY